MNNPPFIVNAIVVWVLLGMGLFAILRTLKLSEDGPEPDGTREPLWVLAGALGLCIAVMLPVALLYFIVGTIAGAR
jgi:hypothetical protein